MGMFDRRPYPGGNGRRQGMNQGQNPEIAHLNGQMMEWNKRINSLYIEIGELYYREHGQDENTDYPQQIKLINQLKAELEQMNDRVQNLNGMKKCPHCGKYHRITETFCHFCGERVVDENQVVCPNCAAVWEKGFLRCQRCGAPLPSDQPQGYNQGYDYATQGYPQGQPQGFGGSQPQGYPQGQPQGFGGGQPQGYPQGQPQGFGGGQPQGYPQGQPQGFGGQPQGFGSQPQGYEQPQGFGGQPEEFGSQPQGYEQPQGFGGQPQEFGSQPQGFGGQPQEFDSQPQEFGGQPQEFDSQPQEFGGQPQGFDQFREPEQSQGDSQPQPQEEPLPVIQPVETEDTFRGFRPLSMDNLRLGEQNKAPKEEASYDDTSDLPKIQVGRCPHCNAELEAGAHFCVQCGNRV